MLKFMTILLCGVGALAAFAVVALRPTSAPEKSKGLGIYGLVPVKSAPATPAAKTEIAAFAAG